MKEKRTFGSLFFGVFCSDLIPKAKKVAHVHLFIQSFTFMDDLIMYNVLAVKNPVNYTSEFRELLKLLRTSE